MLYFFVNKNKCGLSNCSLKPVHFDGYSDNIKYEIVNCVFYERDYGSKFVFLTLLIYLENISPFNSGYRNVFVFGKQFLTNM